MPKKRPAIKPAAIKIRKKRTKRTLPEAEETLVILEVETPVVEIPVAVEPLNLPQDNLVDQCVDSRLKIDGSLSAPSYPDVPPTEPEPIREVLDAKEDQRFLTAQFSQIVVRRTLSISQSLEESTKFTLTGVAAFIALIISNAGGVREFVSESGFKLGIVLFVASLVVGALSKLLGAGVSAGLAALKELEDGLKSPDATDLMQRMTATPEQVSRDIAGSFPWPISMLYSSAAMGGSRDLLAPEKIYTRLFFAQIITNLLHWLLGIVAILVFAFSMSGRG